MLSTRLFCGEYDEDNCTERLPFPWIVGLIFGLIPYSFSFESIGVTLKVSGMLLFSFTLVLLELTIMGRNMKFKGLVVLLASGPVGIVTVLESSES